MDKKFFKLIESLVFNKRLQLNENIFLDPDIWGDDDDYQQIYNDAANEIAGIEDLKLVECTDKGTVSAYLESRTGIREYLSKFLQDLMDLLASNKYQLEWEHSRYNNTDPLNRSYMSWGLFDSYICKGQGPRARSQRYPYGINYNWNSTISINIPILTQDDMTTELLISVEPVTIDNASNLIDGVTVYGMKIGYQNKAEVTLISNYVKNDECTLSDYDIHGKIDSYNNSQDVFGRFLDKTIDTIFEEQFNLDRIVEELTCSEKIYKIAEKDIQRQAKMLKTDSKSQAAGFLKITNKQKMVARLVATFICAYYFGDTSTKLEISDYTFLRLFTNNNKTGSTKITPEVSRWTSTHNYRTQRYKNVRSKASCIAILETIRNWPDIHLKDICATYLKYKDDPQVVEWVNKYKHEYRNM